MKWATILFALLVIVAGCFYLFSGETAQVVHTPNLPQIKIGGLVINLEVASTTQTRERGLSGRQSLGEDTGMFFIFERPGIYGFWMKEMNFPIDIIWLDENLKVSGLKVGATPESYPEVFYPEGSSKYVLEVNLGFVSKTGLKIGDSAELF